MKKVFVFAVVVGGLMATTTSCKKDYNCDCTIAGVTTTSVIKDAKKKDAQDACDALNVTSALVGGSCTLK